MIKTYHIDRIILSLLSIILLVDVINGFLLFNKINISISQIFKSLILFLMLFRLTANPKELIYTLTFFLSLAIGPILGFIESNNSTYFLKDLVVIIKWVNVVVSFFYFKAVIQSSYINKLIFKFKKVFKYSIIIIAANLFLGLLGFGKAFYNHGYGNASGTKGFFFAGNELSVLTLVLMSIVMFVSIQKSMKKFYLYGVIGVLMSLVMGSKTIVLGLIIVFIFLYVKAKEIKFSVNVLLKYIKSILIILPLFIGILYYAITSTNMVRKLGHSFRRNNYDIVTTIMSNRNNFVKNGLVQFHDYNFTEKLFGIGQALYVEKTNHVAEIDTFTLLFSNGYINLFFHIIFVIFIYLQAKIFSKQSELYVFSRFILFMLIFLTIIANFAGHIYNSGISGLFIGLLFAMMYLRKDRVNIKLIFEK